MPEGSRAQAGIGCHFMASWMDRDTDGLIQMGGEGVDWVSHAMFTNVPHVFQNLGDGTYYHSGYLAIRQAVAARRRITYKILFNDAVAMTGGQPVDGIISVDGIARQVEAEGVKQVVVVSPTTSRKYDAIKSRFPAGTEFHDRAELDAVQRRLREMPGVTVLIYEQTCAAEKRRRAQEGRAGRSGAAPLHQRAGLRGLRRLLGAEQLRRGAAAGDAARAQAQDRPERLQQGLFLRQGLLPELRRRDGRQACARRPAR